MNECIITFEVHIEITQFFLPQFICYYLSLEIKVDNPRNICLFFLVKKDKTLLPLLTLVYSVKHTPI